MVTLKKIKSWREKFTLGQEKNNNLFLINLFFKIEAVTQPLIFYLIFFLILYFWLKKNFFYLPTKKANENAGPWGLWMWCAPQRQTKVFSFSLAPIHKLSVLPFVLNSTCTSDFFNGLLGRIITNTVYHHQQKALRIVSSQHHHSLA